MSTEPQYTRHPTGGRLALVIIGAPVGVARPAQVDAYLGDAGRAVLQDVEFAPFNPTHVTSGSADASPSAPWGC